MTKISVIGTGYLGATHAAALAELGWDVVGVDLDPLKVAALTAAEPAFYEPGLPELLRRNIDAGRLTFTTDLVSAVASADIHFICVGTPQSATSTAADLSYVERAVAECAAAIEGEGLIVGKSTVPVGTAARLREIIDASAPDHSSIELLWNPEFLREGRAIEDSLHPDRIVVGAESESATDRLLEVYRPLLDAGVPLVRCGMSTAELVKVAANSFLATKISFINAMAELCEVADADVLLLAEAIGMDPRIGSRFLHAGLGFGGGCLPKDIRAFMHRASELGALSAVGLLHQVDEINMRQRHRIADLAVRACGGSVLGVKIAVLGAAFKPGTDDVRDSPALNVAAALHLRGAHVEVYDPAANGSGREMFPTLSFADRALDAVAGADLILVLTEWPEFTALDPREIVSLVHRAVVIDGRNCLDRERWEACGWDVLTIGSRGAGPDSVLRRHEPPVTVR